MEWWQHQQRIPSIDTSRHLQQPKSNIHRFWRSHSQIEYYGDKVKEIFQWADDDTILLCAGIRIKFFPEFNKYKLVFSSYFAFQVETFALILLFESGVFLYCMWIFLCQEIFSYRWWGSFLFILNINFYNSFFLFFADIMSFSFVLFVVYKYVSDSRKYWKFNLNWLYVYWLRFSNFFSYGLIFISW